MISVLEKQESKLFQSLPLRNNIIPITTTKGGLLFIDEQLQIRSILNTSNGLDFDYVTSFIQDRAGDVWATSDNIFKVSF